MRRWLLILLAVSQIGAAKPALTDSNAFEPVSLIAIVANPDLFDGKRVRVEGFLILEFEGDSLYLDKSAYEASLTRNALWIGAPAWADPRTQRGLTRRYVFVEGTFNPRHHGHMGAWPGALENVRLIRPAFTRGDFEQYMLRNSNGVLRQAIPGGLAVFFGLLIAFSLLARLRIRRRPRL